MKKTKKLPIKDPEKTDTGDTPKTGNKTGNRSEKKEKRPTGKTPSPSASPSARSRKKSVLSPVVLNRLPQPKSPSITRNHRRYPKVIDEMSDGCCETDLDGRLVFANHMLCENLKYTPDELAGTVFYTLQPTPSAKKAATACNKIHKTGKPLKSLEIDLVTRKGDLITFEATIALIKDDQEKATGFRYILRDIRERKKMESELREAAEKYSNIIETIQDGYFETDLTGNLTFVNDALSRNIGYSKKELVGMNYRQYTDQINAQKVFQIFNKLYLTGNPPGVFDYEVIRKDGGKASAEISVSLIRDANGTPVGFRGTSRDITEGKMVIAELRKSEERYRTILEDIDEGYFEVDFQGIFTFVNDALCRDLGYARKDLIGMDYRKMTDPSLIEKIQDIYTEVYKTGQTSARYEATFIHKDGSRHINEVSVSLMRDARGMPTGFRGVSRDITERVHAEEAIRVSEERHRTILENIQEGYFENDLAGRIIFINDTACRHLGYTREELLGTKTDFVQDEEGTKKTIQAYRKLFETGIPIKTLESEIIRKDGSKGIYELSADLIRNAQGKPIGFRSVSRDITERKRAEELLMKTNQELQKATARANEMAARAEAANIAKGEFLANMSHEIRTPMNGVIGMIGLLLDTKLNEEQRRYAEIVRASGELLLELINNILDFSKIEARKLELESIDFDLLNLLDDFAATLAVPAHEKGLEVICSADLDVPTLLRGDPGRLRQILTNLAGNAVKFTHAGEVAVNVSLADDGNAHGNVLLRFSIKDTGIGIPQDKISLLFNKFTQVDASTTRQYGGSGLGLAISRQISELMGGQIGVESVEGKGSEFWFTIRFDLQSGVGPKETLPSADLQNVRTLIVDDNATNREILSTRLASWGMRPAEAQDGPRAVQALYRAFDDHDPFRIALIDMQMPGMDGETLGRIIKADKRLADVRLVLLTSLGNRGDVQRIQEAGFVAYLTKPIRYQELKALLSLALSRQGDEPAPAHPLLTRHAVYEIPKVTAARNTRVLLAEDNVTNQMVAVGMLKKLGLRADAVSNGLEAVKALETIPYDLVLMDVQMPEMDGLEATRTIRNWQAKPGTDMGEHLFSMRIRASNIPIIAMTAYAMEGDREKCLAAGMNDYVSKPLSPKALAEALNKWLPKDAVTIEEKISPAKNIYSRSETDLSASSVFDPEDMLDRLTGDEKLGRIVSARFLKDIPRQIQTLKSDLDAGDAPSVRRQIHSIKGAAANIGGKALYAVAFEMEKAAIAENLVAIRERLPDMQIQFDRLREAVDKYYQDKK